MNDRDAAVPTYYDLIWPTLQAVVRLGGSATKDELETEVIYHENYTEAQQQVLKGDGPTTLLLDRLSWARSYLKGMGLFTNPRRSVWAVTERGEAASSTDIKPLHDDYVARARAGRRQTRAWQETAGDDTIVPSPDASRRLAPLAADDADLEGHPEQDDSSSWRDALLEQMLNMHPTSFEHLAKRLLREAGFSRVAVTGRANDGGVDGQGVLTLSMLLSFPVYFQCKRYRGSVGSSTVRDFRGAMAGRGDKGLLITTGSFTVEAQREATRDGAPPIDLIDGAALCELLKQLNLGVRTVERVVEDVSIDTDFFAAFANSDRIEK